MRLFQCFKHIIIASLPLPDAVNDPVDKLEQEINIDEKLDDDFDDEDIPPPSDLIDGDRNMNMEDFLKEDTLSGMKIAYV